MFELLLVLRFGSVVVSFMGSGVSESFLELKMFLTLFGVLMSFVIDGLTWRSEKSLLLILGISFWIFFKPCCSIVNPIVSPRVSRNKGEIGPEAADISEETESLSSSFLSGCSFNTSSLFLNLRLLALGLFISANFWFLSGLVRLVWFLICGSTVPVCEIIEALIRKACPVFVDDGRPNCPNFSPAAAAELFVPGGCPFASRLHAITRLKHSPIVGRSMGFGCNISAVIPITL